MRVPHGFWLPLLGLALAGCTQPQTGTQFLEARKKEPLFVLYGADYLTSEAGNPQARLRTTRLEEWPDPEHANQTMTRLGPGVRIEFFAPDGVVRSWLTADAAEMYPHRDYGEAQGNVRVVGEAGDTLETERLRWNRKANTLSTDGLVTIRTPTELVYGDSMVADARFTSYEIFNLRGVVQVDEAE